MTHKLTRNEASLRTRPCRSSPPLTAVAARLQFAPASPSVCEPSAAAIRLDPGGRFREAGDCLAVERADAVEIYAVEWRPLRACSRRPGGNISRSSPAKPREIFHTVWWLVVFSRWFNDCSFIIHLPLQRVQLRDLKRKTLQLSCFSLRCGCPVQKECCHHGSRVYNHMQYVSISE